MVNRKIWLGMLVTALVFGFLITGCSDDPNPGGGDIVYLTGSGGGKFTLTDIPSEHNGKYAFFEQYFEQSGPQVNEPDTYLIGCESINKSTGTVKLPAISGGQVIIPMGIVNVSSSSISKYSGSDTVTGVVIIYDSQTVSDFWGIDVLTAMDFGEIAFTNGNADKSWNDGEEVHDEDFYSKD